MYSTHNEGKSAVAERFIITLKNKIQKHMTANSENVYFNVLNDIVGEYNNTYHKTIKVKPVDVSKLSDAVKNDVVEKTEYDKLVAKVDKIDTTVFVLKTTYDTDKSDLEKRISDEDKNNS